MAAVHEFRQIFRGYAGSPRFHQRPRPYPQQRPQPAQWAHNFFCLADSNAVTVPTGKVAKKKLSDAGLGEKRLQVSVNASAIDLHRAITTAFPKLEDCGGYTLLKCIPNSRNLQVLEPYTSHTPKSLRDVVGQSRIYIRPLQKSISLDVLPLDSNSADLEVCYCQECILSLFFIFFALFFSYRSIVQKKNA